MSKWILLAFCGLSLQIGAVRAFAEDLSGTVWTGTASHKSDHVSTVLTLYASGCKITNVYKGNSNSFTNCAWRKEGQLVLVDQGKERGFCASSYVLNLMNDGRSMEGTNHDTGFGCRKDEWIVVLRRSE